MPMMEHTKLTIRSENYFIPFRPLSSVDPPVRRDKKVDGQVMGKDKRRENWGWFGMIRNETCFTFSWGHFWVNCFPGSILDCFGFRFSTV